MTIQKSHSVLEKDWYFATQKLSEYKGNYTNALGFGGTHYSAIVNCLQDIEVIKKLQDKQK